MSASISSYGSAVSQLQAASRGTYPGPSVPERVLEKAYETILGLDTGQLRSGGRLAAGESETGGLLGWLKPIGRVFGGVAGGMIVNELVERVWDWVDNRNEAEEVAEAADRAADAIDTTIRESDDGVNAILDQLAGIIAQISSHLSSLDPTDHPEAFIATVQAGAEIINDAATMILGLCGDRDRAIESCYGALIEHGRRVCEAPAPGVAPAASGTGGAGGGDASGGATGGGAGGGGASGATPDTPGTMPATTPASVDPPKENSPKEDAPKENSPEADTATGKTPPEACDPELEPDRESVKDTNQVEPVGSPQREETEVDAPPIVEDNWEHTMTDMAGAIGVGLLVVGVGILVDFLGEVAQTMGMDAVQIPPTPVSDTAPLVAAPAETPETTGTTEAAAAATPDEESVVAPVPEPTPDPTPASEPTPDPTPASELHLVAEPPPKPQPGMMQAAATASVSEPMVGEPVQADYHQAATPVGPVGPTAPPPPPTPGDTPGDVPGRVRRAGGW